MSIVWPCPLTVDAYASMGRAVQVPRPDCPSCLVPAVFWLLALHPLAGAGAEDLHPPGQVPGPAG